MKKAFIIKITSFLFAFAMFLGIMFVLPNKIQTVYTETTPNYLTLTAKGGTAEITFKYYEGTDVEYSLNGGEWTDCKEAQDSDGDVFTLEADEYVQLRGTNVSTYFEIDQQYKFFMTTDTNATVEASGDVTSLTNRVGGNAQLVYRACYLMFSDCTILTKAPNLPSTTLSDMCYSCMFSCCTNLTNAPELPATTLTYQCYTSMFYGCTSLVNAPELPATTLAELCYYGMFCKCTSLVNAPELPAKTLANSCYLTMFSCCTNLTNAPELPATTLAVNCYEGMFNECKSLVNAPELPATTLSSGCYKNMFEKCTSLVNAPELPATTLEDYCYYGMFRNCTSLVNAPELPAKIMKSHCYGYMFSCTSILKPVDISHVTSLADNCFELMYNCCTNIAMTTETEKAGYTIEWTIPNISTATDWNLNMFYGCAEDNCCDISHPTGDYANANVNTTYYVAKYYNVVFDLNGGSGTTPTDDNVYRVGNHIDFNDGTGLSCGDYIFKGWNASSSAKVGDSGCVINSEVLKNLSDDDDTITFYPIWQNPYLNYEYKLDNTESGIEWVGTVGAVFNAGDEIVIKNSHYWGVYKLYIKVNDSIIAEIEYASYGDSNIYTYHVNNNGAYVKTLTTNNDDSDYILIIDKFSLNYDSNGGSGTVTHKSTLGAIDIGKTITLASGDNLTRSGYKFAGWNTKADGSGTTYSAGDYYTILATDFDDNNEATLYALWNENIIDEQPTSSNDYTVILVDDYKDNTNITYQWYKKIGDNEPVVIDGETTNKLSTSLVLEDATYYCEILLNSEVLATSDSISPCLIEFKGNSNTTGDNISIYQLKGRSINLPDTPFTYSKKAYQFDGCNDGENVLDVNDSYTVEEDFEFAAEYSLETHTCEYVSNATPLTSDFTGGKLESGSYYLYEDIVVTSSITFDDGAIVTIDLNGHVLSGKKQSHNLNGYYNFSSDPFFMFEITDNVKLSIVDCDDTTVHKFSYFNLQTENGYYTTLDEDGDISITGGVITNVVGTIFHFSSDEYIDGNTEALTLKNITITGNHAFCSNVSNGLLYNTYDPENNYYYETDIDFDNVYVYGNELVVTTSTVSLDLKSFFNFGDENNYDYKVNLKDVTFENNYALSYGTFYGMIGLYSNNGDDTNGVIFDNVDFINNKIVSGGSASYIHGAMIYINAGNNNILYSNTDKAIKLTNCDFTNNYVETDVSINGLINHDCYVIANNCTFTNNTLKSDDYSESSCVHGGMFLSKYFLKLANTTISNNTIHTTKSIAGKYCGLVCTSDSDYTLEIDNVTVEENTIYTKPATQNYLPYNSGYFIYSGYSLKINDLTFTENEIIVNKYIFGTETVKSANYYGTFIFTQNILNGLCINDDETIDISNLTFDSNTFTDESTFSSSNSSSIIQGGLIATTTKTRYTAVNFTGNKIDTNAVVQGGLVYCAGELAFNPGEVENGQTITYIKSIFDGNSVITTLPNSYNNFKSSGGLIYGLNNIDLDRAEFTDNTVYIGYSKINYDQNCGLLIANNSDEATKLVKITNCLINNNNATGYEVLGLIYGHFDIEDTEISDNTISALKFNGGILCSYTETYTSIVYSESTNGTYVIDNVDILNNKFGVVKNDNYKTSAHGLFINTSSVKLTVNDLNIDNNTMLDETQSIDEVYGVVLAFTINKYNYENANMSLENISFTNNEFNIDSLNGGFIFNTKKSAYIHNLTFKENIFNVDTLFGGFACTDGEHFENVEFSDNTFNITTKNYANYFDLFEYNLGESVDKRQRVVFDGDIIFSNNTFTKSYADIVCSNLTDSDTFVKVLSSTTSTSLTKFTPMTYQTNYEVETSELLYTHAENYFKKGYISLYEDKYFINLVDEDDDKVIKIFNRFVEDPTSDNGYKYVLNDQDTTITYGWYVYNNGYIDLEIYKNKTNLDDYLYGTFYCIGTTAGGFDYISTQVVIEPEIIEAPTEDNGYKLVFDETKIQLYDVGVTYSWETMSSFKTNLYTLIDDTKASAFAGTTDDIIAEANYDSNNGYWYCSEGNALGIQNLKINPGEQIAIDLSCSYDGDVIYTLYPFFGSEDFENRICNMMFEYMYSNYDSGVVTLYYPDSSWFEENPSYTEGEEFVYTIVAYVNDMADYNYQPLTAKIAKYSVNNETSYVDDENIHVFTDIGCTYDSTTKLLSQIDGQTSGLVEVYLEKGDNINFIYTDECDACWYNSSNVTVLRTSEHSDTVADLFTNGEDVYSHSNSFVIFNTFSADEDGYYAFIFALKDDDGETVLLNAKMLLGGFDGYSTVEGQDSNELDNVSDGDYLCCAKFSSDTFGDTTVRTDTAKFVSRSVTYNANGQTVTVPTDSSTYKNTKEFTLLGDADDLKVANKNLVGWSTSEDGSETIYQIGDTFTMGKEALTLYAIYEDKEQITIDTTLQTEHYGEQTGYVVDGPDGVEGYNVYYFDSETSSWVSTVPNKMGSFNIKITRDEDDTYQAFETVIYNGYAIYFIVNFDGNGADSGEAPVEVHCYGITPGNRLPKNGNTLVKEGFEVVGWLLPNSDNTSLDFYNLNQFAVYFDETTFYACWAPVINEDLSSNNDYTIDTDATNITYQWYKIVDSNEVAITEETGNKISQVYGDSQLYCVLSYTNTVNSLEYVATTTSNKITPVKISYNGGTDASGSIESVYQLEGRDITLAANAYIKTGYRFNNWSDGTNTYAASSTIKTPSSDLALIANWIEKDDVNISEATQSSVDYDGETHEFVITGTPSTGFTVYYATHADSHEESDWSTSAPVNAGVYDVKIIRDEDDDYKEYSCEIASAITINKVKVTVTTNSDSEFIYNGKDQISSVSATYKDVNGNDVDLVTIACRRNDLNEAITTSFMNAGYYDVAFIFSTDLEEQNYILDDEYIDTYVDSNYAISPKEVSIDWEEKSYTYDGSTFTTPTASYKDIDGNNVSLTVTLNDLFKNAGSYTATAEFANSETNYCLGDDPTNEYSIARATTTINTTNVVKEYTYDGNEITIDSGATLNHSETTLVYSDNKFTNAGKYTVTITTAETTNYLATSVTVEIIVNKAKVTKPTEDTTEYVYNSSEQQYSLATSSLYTISDDKRTNAGTQTVIVALKDKDNYVWADDTNTDLEFTFTIAKATATIDTTGVETEYTYTGSEQVVDSGATLNHKETSLVYTNNTFTNVGSGKYTITISADETANYLAATTTVEISVAKATATIDTTGVVKEYTYTGSVQTVNSGATLNHNEATLVYTNNTFTNVGSGSFTITISADETANYLATSTTVEITVNKMKVDEPTVAGNYVYNGEEQIVTLYNLKDYMETTDSELKATTIGDHIIHISLDNNHEWNEGSDGIVVWTIKADKITPKEDTPEGEEPKKEDVIVETEEGFSEDITVTVVVTLETEVKETELTVDYYNLIDETVKLANNEKVGVVFDVKLIRTVNGVETVIQPSDIAPGTTIKVKMLIPENVDISKVTRILHVHSADNIEVIEFNPELVDENGYYEIEISELSEFAFVYKTMPVWAIILIVLGSLLFIFILLFIFWKKEYDKAIKEDTLDDRNLYRLDPIYLPINNLLFGKEEPEDIKQE